MSAATEFDGWWADSVLSILAATPRTNARTGRRVREEAGLSFSLPGVPLLTLRDIGVGWPAAEAVWFLSGSDDPKFMERFGFKTWTKFAEKGRVRAATGARWRHAFGFDQLVAVLEELKSDDSSRQCVMQAWLPGQDFEPQPHERPKNVPCLTTWHFCLVGGRLNVSVLQRSADMWFGVPHDAAVAGVINALMARHLEVAPGRVSFLYGNAHLYDDQWEPASALASRAPAGAVPGLSWVPRIDLLPAAMDGEEWVVHQVRQELEEWYSRRAGPKVAGPRIAR